MHSIPDGEYERMIARETQLSERVELLERTLRDCLESLEWYAWRAGHKPEDATPTSVIGQARKLVRTCAHCGCDKYSHPVSPELGCPEFAYFVKK